MDLLFDGVDWLFGFVQGMEGGLKFFGVDLICVFDCDCEDDWEGQVNEGDFLLGRVEVGKLVYLFSNKEVFGLGIVVVDGILRFEVFEVYWRNLNICYVVEEGYFGVQFDF